MDNKAFDLIADKVERLLTARDLSARRWIRTVKASRSPCIRGEGSAYSVLFDGEVKNTF